MNVSRRAALTALTALTVVGLTACTATTGTVTPAQVGQDINLIATGFASGFKQLPPGTAVPQSVSDAMMEIAAIAASFSAADTIAQAQPLVLRIENDVNSVVAFIAALPMLPPTVSLIFQAGAVLLPIIESGVNLVVPAKSSLNGYLAGNTMTPDEARLILRGAAIHKR